ncbi:hypothetical protein A2Z33_04215 [Candidatus Gottesmanbacteria bacterium RBG_16_52_11]|uniref:EamA domain-containing protein n=1 Tax=Candidatus Gottesmanbacteria bacterium RBG_16_52_11 TaxID=1798374 RepID=A0A1F5YW53_9BACT|nr:MAG: hypothetical protein A2Z33_04215 [Candidatus Gottesmanbacteria bacterium RBG_16_52_11]
MNLTLLIYSGLAVGVVAVLNKRLAGGRHAAIAYSAAFALLNTVFTLPFLLFEFRMPVDPVWWALTITSVIAFAVTLTLGFAAYKTTDVSVVNIIYRLSIVMTALAGLIFLGEQYTPVRYLGLFLVFAGSVAVLFKEKKIRITRGILFAFVMALSTTIATILDKQILKAFSPYTYAFVNNLVLYLILIMKPGTLGDSLAVIRSRPRNIIVSSIINATAFLAILIVLSGTSVSQTMPVFRSLSYVSPILLGILVLGERSDLLQKSVGVALGLMGIILLYL